MGKAMIAQATADTNSKMNWRITGALAFILVLTFLIRVPFLGQQLDSDQADYAYIARSWQQGKLPYQDFFDNKPPIIFLVYMAVLNFAGDFTKNIHLFYALLAVFTTFFLYRLASLMFGFRVALLSAFLYGLFSGGVLITGSFANTENLLVFFVIPAFYFFWVAYKKEKTYLFFPSGIFFGLAILSKQVAFWELAAASFFLWQAARRKLLLRPLMLKAVLLWGGVLSTVILFVGYFIFKGAGRSFFDAVILYNAFFGRIVGLSQAIVNLWRAFFWTPRENFFLWALAALGLFKIYKNRQEERALFVLCWFAASILGVSSALRFYPHYFIQAMPVLSILAGIYLGLTFFTRPTAAKKYLGMILLILAICSFLRVEWDYYFKYTPLESLINCRGGLARPKIYKATAEVAAFIRQKTSPRDYIYIWGFWPEIYFYSQRQAASKYFLFSSRGAMIGSMGERIQQRVFADILKHKPKYFIIDYYFEYLIRPQLAKYLKDNYLLQQDIEEVYRILRRKGRDPEG